MTLPQPDRTATRTAAGTRHDVFGPWCISGNSGAGLDWFSPNWQHVTDPHADALSQQCRTDILPPVQSPVPGWRAEAG